MADGSIIDENIEKSFDKISRKKALVAKKIKVISSIFIFLYKGLTYRHSTVGTYIYNTKHSFDRSSVSNDIYMQLILAFAKC